MNSCLRLCRNKKNEVFVSLGLSANAQSQVDIDICLIQVVCSYLIWRWACASSNSFLRNRSKPAMQSSRASDRSDREHLQNQNKKTKPEEHMMKTFPNTVTSIKNFRSSYYDISHYIKKKKTFQTKQAFNKLKKIMHVILQLPPLNIHIITVQLHVSPVGNF